MLSTILAHSDLASVVTLRNTSRTAYVETVGYLLYQRRRLVEHYLPDESLFWDLAEDAHAVISGPSALAYIRFDLDILPDTLDVFVGMLEAELFLQLLEEEFDLAVESDIAPSPWRNVKRTVTFQSKPNRYIAIHVAVGVSALEPAVSFHTTILCNYIARHTFAVGYPALTFASVGLEGRDHPATTYDDFTTIQYPHQLPNLSVLPVDNQSGTVPCLRSLYLCPNMARFFGDRGSYVVRFEPLKISRDNLRAIHSPPYGLTVIWRMVTGEKPCDSPCNTHDPILPPEHLTLPSCMPSDCVVYDSFVKLL